MDVQGNIKNLQKEATYIFWDIVDDIVSPEELEQCEGHTHLRLLCNKPENNLQSMAPKSSLSFNSNVQTNPLHFKTPSEEEPSAC